MPSTDAVLSLVERFIADKKYASAMAQLVSISNHMSRDLRFLGLLAFTQKARNDNSGLVKTLETIAKITDNPASHLDYMSALYSAGRLNEALDVGLFLQEQKLDDVCLKYFTRIMVRLYLEFSDFEGVSEVVERYSYGREPDDLMNWALGFVALSDGRRDEAIEYFRKSIEQNSQSDQGWISLAMLHDEVGDRELAMANLERALEINPHNSTGLKLISKWATKDKQRIQNTIERLNFYLSRHAFDEELSLCYVQLLREGNYSQIAEFELQKVLLNNPLNEAALNMKNNLEEVGIS